MEKQIDKLNCLRIDFKRWADSNEPSTWELDLNKIGGQITDVSPNDDPVVLLDCSDSEGNWYLCVNSSDCESGCYPITELSKTQVFEIRRIVESWLARKDMDFFNI